jgi:hypothetical protein
MHHLHTFGCTTHVKQGSKRLAKLEDCSTLMVVIGYEGGNKAWRFYDPRGECVYVSHDIGFEEDRA